MRMAKRVERLTSGERGMENKRGPDRCADLCCLVVVFLGEKESTLSWLLWYLLWYGLAGWRMRPMLQMEVD